MGIKCVGHFWSQARVSPNELIRQHFMTKYPNLTGLTGKELSDANETLCV